MTAESIEVFFDRYAKAFSCADVDAVTDLWSFPAFISTPERDVVFAEQEFRKNTKALCDFYGRQGLARAEKTIASIHHLADDVASVCTIDTLFDDAGEQIATWKHAYMLRETDAGIRASIAVADAELTAWRTRGTPLGS
jgi:hypothetical protein